MVSMKQVWTAVLLASCACSTEPRPAPLVCTNSMEGCECGRVGCSCSDDRQCSEGVCNEYSDTCVLERDGMVHVPAGRFAMGCHPDRDPLGDAYPHVPNVPRICEDELYPATPYRQVHVDGFWIDRTEVTKAQYRKCIEAGVCTPPLEWDIEYDDGTQTLVPTPDDRPAGGLTWPQATAFCGWVGKRLPTEAEWEKTARGSDGRKYPWGNEPEPDCSLAIHIWDTPHGYVGCSDTRLAAVGSIPANTSPYGAVDMAGNVEEWTLDSFGSYADLPDTNPIRTGGDDRIRRGCSFQCPTVGGGGYILRTSYRFIGGSDTTWEFLSQGVRCARDERPEDPDQVTVW